MAISAQFVVVVPGPTRLHWTSLRNLWLFLCYYYLYFMHRMALVFCVLLDSNCTGS